MVEDGYDAKDDGDTPDYRQIVGMDPAANWLLGVAAADFLVDGEQTDIPFLLTLEDREAVAAFRELVARTRDDPRSRVVIFWGEEQLPPTGGPVAAAAKRAFFDRLARGDEEFRAFAAANKSIVLSDPAHLPDLADAQAGLPHETGAESGRDASDGREALRQAVEGIANDQRDRADAPVVTAVIDDGIAFAHARLRNGASTRVAHFWNMNLWSGFGSLTPGPIAGELTRSDIDALTQDATHGGAIDEDAVYRAAQLIDHRDPRHKAAAWRISHGAHVTDLAAGYDPGEEMPERPIVAVQLPTLAVARTVGKLLEVYIFLALQFVLARVDRMAGEGPALPLVVNTSFGYVAGAHDGKAPLERVFDAVIEARAPKTQIVLPAGNAQMSQCHAEIDLAGNETVAFDWIVQSDDRTQSVVEIWLPASQTPQDDPFERIVLNVTQPDGTATTIAETPFALRELKHRGRRMGLVLLARRHFDGRRMLRLQILPTARPQPDPRALAPAGRWRLEFARGENALEGSAHAWSERDDSLYGYPQRGRQAYFEHPEYHRHDAAGFDLADEPDDPPTAPVTRASLLNSFASGQHVITAGGYQERDCRIADYSAGGPNTPPEGEPARKPDVLLPSDGSRAQYGMLAAGSRSGGRVALNGTSVAAPQLARHVADMLAAGQTADRAAVKVAATASDVCDESAAADPPERSGWGRLSRRDGLPVAR